MAFSGYLLQVKVGNAWTTFPNAYIDYESWQSSPRQIEDVRAYRDDYSRNLTRIIANGRKSAFSFNTRDGMKLSEKEALITLLNSAYTIANERKLDCKFWCDDDNSYHTGTFYIANIQWQIKQITDNSIIYKPTKFDFVEY